MVELHDHPTKEHLVRLEVNLTQEAARAFQEIAARRGITLTDAVNGAALIAKVVDHELSVTGTKPRIMFDRGHDITSVVEVRNMWGETPRSGRMPRKGRLRR